MMPLLGNAAENKKIPSYAPAQDHYEDAYKVWSDHYQLVAAAEGESVKIVGADPRS